MTTRNNKDPFSVSGKSEFYWEIVDGRTRRVRKHIEKTSDDDNRDEAERSASAFNREWRKRKASASNV